MALRGGRYEVLQSIASGGMAAVHLARALGEGGFERLVAIKVMHPHIAEEPEFVAMFLDEARLAAQIRHPNVVSTTDVQRDEDGIFLVMEYVEGPSLHLLLRTLRNREIDAPLSILLKIFLDSLAGLHAAHELVGQNGELLRLVHRDVSPQNILVGVDGVSRITDFGVARAESRLATTKTGQVKGKARYLAPEQLRSAPLDRRTDVYAAGVVLWEILAEQRLIDGENDLAMFTRILRAEHPSARDVNPRAPEALSAVAMRAIHMEMDERYATSAELAEAVEAAARADGLMIASARRVAEFVRELDAHVGPVELTPVHTATLKTEEISVDVAVEPEPSSRAPAPSSGQRPPPSLPETLASAAPPPSDPISAVSTLSKRPQSSPRGPRGLLVGLGIGVVATSALWWSLGSSRGEPPRVSEPARSIALGRAAAAVASASISCDERADASLRPEGGARDRKSRGEAESASDAKELKAGAVRAPLAAASAAPSVSSTAKREPSFLPKDL